MLWASARQQTKVDASTRTGHATNAANGPT
jgi:hypothetical protein